MATPFELPIDYTFETDPAEFRTQTGDREDNTLFGDDGRDRLLGGDGDDVLFADNSHNSRDYLEGDQGNDILYGNRGVDGWDQDRFAFGKGGILVNPARVMVLSLRTCASRASQDGT
jgi:Ca2+-binding RTX toxin-like protein